MPTLNTTIENLILNLYIFSFNRVFYDITETAYIFFVWNSIPP